MEQGFLLCFLANKCGILGKGNGLTELAYRRSRSSDIRWSHARFNIGSTPYRNIDHNPFGTNFYFTPEDPL